MVDIQQNHDNLYEAIHGLDIFQKNFCMNVAETEKQGDLTFRCNECPFNKNGICVVHVFAKQYGKKSGYDMTDFGAMVIH